MKNKKLMWLYVLSASIYFVQGIEGLPGLSIFAFMKEHLHFSPSKIMYIGSLVSLAWLVKPLFGFISDNFLSNKKWILISLLGSLGICLYLGLSPYIPLFILIPILMLANVNAAMRDVSCDGMMCITGKKTNTCNKIQSIQWISITVASIFVGLFGGYIADHYSYKIGYLFLIPIYLIILIIVSKYKTIVSKNRTHVQKNEQSLLQSILSYKELFTNKQFLLGCLFLFVYKFAPGFGTPLSFIERDTFGWSYTFMSILGAVGSVVSIIGAIIYYKISHKLNVKKVLFWSIFLVGITNLAYLYFTPVTDVIYTIIFSFLGMFIFLNTMTWMAKNTLSGKEATSFALLCSINNLSGTLSTLTGAWLFPLLGLKLIIVLASISAFASLPILKKLDIK